MVFEEERRMSPRIHYHYHYHLKEEINMKNRPFVIDMQAHYIPPEALNWSGKQRNTIIPLG